MTTTSSEMQVEQCPKCRGMREVPSGYDRFASGLMAWRICPVCDGLGAVEVEPDPVESAVVNREWWRLSR